MTTFISRSCWARARDCYCYHSSSSRDNTWPRVFTSFSSFSFSTLTLSSPGLARVQVLLLPGPAVLEPDLRHPLAEPGDLGDALQVLAVRIGVDLEVGLQDLDLLLREGRPHSLGLLLVVALRLVALGCKFNRRR